MVLNKVMVEYAVNVAQSKAISHTVYVKSKCGEMKQGGAIRDSTQTGDLARGVGWAK